MLDILVWVEATIYQLDEDNEKMAKQGHVQEHLHILADSALPAVLESLGLLDDRIRAELTQGDLYWAGERRLCQLMLNACIPKAPATSMGMGHSSCHFDLSEALAVHEKKSFDYRVSVGVKKKGLAGWKAWLHCFWRPEGIR